MHTTVATPGTESDPPIGSVPALWLRRIGLRVAVTNQRHSSRLTSARSLQQLKNRICRQISAPLRCPDGIPLKVANEAVGVKLPPFHNNR